MNQLEALSSKRWITVELHGYDKKSDVYGVMGLHERLRSFSVIPIITCDEKT
ncbi:hypothetical protein LCGC14_0220360 [marine sediment metagenome]|uniref:Uncharacterized protein n=1 Tax=marine sediment metagenome TaxID=412755 RepID=A0A0F9UDA6_9ZZZZ